MKYFKFLLLGLFISSIVLLTGCQSDDVIEGGPEGPEIPISSQKPGTGEGFEFKDNQNGIEGLQETPGELGPADAPVGPKPGEWTVLEGIDLPVVYFAYDQDSIGTSEREKLDKVADYLQQNQAVGVIIEGHCDERGSIEYNRALGERRAIAVRNYLVNLGIPDARFQTISFGEERPAVDGKDPEAWTKNRRAELKAAKIN